MKARIIFTLFTLLLLAGCKPTPKVDYLNESQADRDIRMEWWREARFGMFIHWGLYAVPAGEWNGQTNHGEWIRTSAQIPLEEYDQFVDQFNPVRFNADDWVKMAKDAGMKYIVITSKHHDGFGLFNSRQTDFDVMSTPFKRDILKELSVACKKEGIILCFYHSIMDWHHPDYLPRREWETGRSAEGANFSHYVDYMKAQLKELLTRYGKIGVLWFDGEWENTWTGELGTDLYQYVRNLQPSIIINNRVGVGRAGMEGLTQAGQFGGDFGTPEQQIPGTGIPGYDWETCMTMNDHWGYNKNDKNFKSTREMIRMLADIASKGGNYLLNIGPKADGTFPSESIERLKDIGNWMKINGEAIYGSQASPFKSLPFGRCTQKKMTGSTRLYLHVFDWPADGQLTLGGLGSNPIRAFALADPAQDELKIERQGDALVIAVGWKALDQDNTVIVLDIEGDPAVYDAPEITHEEGIFIEQDEITLSKKENLSEIRYTLDGSEPTVNSVLYGGPFLINSTTTIKAACFRNGEPVSSVATRTIENVIPTSGRTLPEAKPGLLYFLFSGEFSKMPDLNGLNPKMTGIATDFSLAKNPADDKFALDYRGFINVPEDGIYTFRLTSDDGSLLYINEAVIVDNDGLHGATAMTGTLALGKGLHPLRVSFFESSGGNTLQLEWKKSGGTYGEVPAGALFHYK